MNLGDALALAVELLRQDPAGGPSRTLTPTQLEAAVLDRARPRRTFPAVWPGHRRAAEQRDPTRDAHDDDPIPGRHDTLTGHSPRIDPSRIGHDHRGHRCNRRRWRAGRRRAGGPRCTAAADRARPHCSAAAARVRMSPSRHTRTPRRWPRPPDGMGNLPLVSATRTPTGSRCNWGQRGCPPGRGRAHRSGYSSFMGAAASATFPFARDHGATEGGGPRGGDQPSPSMRNSLYADSHPGSWGRTR